MTWQESLDRSKKQHEKSQATLTSIAAKAGGSSRGAANQRATPTPPSPAVKFSSDTERLQLINSIRKAPAGAQIKRVIDLLFETRRALTSQQINEACYVDINSNQVVFLSLKNNPKVSYEEGYFAYKSKHDVKDKNELLNLIRYFPKGIAVTDLKDAYPTVMEDIQALKAEGLIWLLSNFDSQEDIAYPNDPRALLKVDDDLKLLFRSIELPQEMIVVEKELRKYGMRPLTNTAQRREKAQIDGVIPNKHEKKKKKNGISKRTKLTNSHLPEIFK